MLRDFLRDDDSSAARSLLAKVSTDGGTNDLMLCLADCLHEYVQAGITAKTVHEQVRLYAEA
jgi:hypothetical protein